MTISARTIHVCLLPLLLVGTMIAQSQHFKRTITVNGRSGEVNVYSIDGKSFVDLESLASLSNGSLTFHGNEITLIVPPPRNEQAQEPPQRPGSGAMSGNFMKSGVEFLSAIRRWTSVLKVAAQKGVPGDGSNIVLLRDRAAEALRLAQVDSSTAADESSYQMLATHFNDVRRWSDRLVAERRSMDTAKYSMSAEALEQDPAYRRITTCTAFLNSMIPGGQYKEEPNCR